jgi:hypothetical protein
LSGDWCPPGTACVDSDADGVSRCERRAAKGERCNPHDFLSCADGPCDPETLVCLRGPAEGEPCTPDDCGEDLVCRDGVCQVQAEHHDSRRFCTATSACPIDEFCGPEAACIAGPVACDLRTSIEFCLYTQDGICDEPEGTGLCLEGTDPDGCGGS